MRSQRRSLELGWIGRTGILLILITCSAIATSAQEPADDPLPAQAAEFGKIFLDGSFDLLHDRMTTGMQDALTPQLSAQVREQLLESGEVVSIGEAWLETATSAYRRYRVPVQFENATIDLRVVFDQYGKVAGFFQAPHVEPPTEGATKQEPARPQEPGHPFPYEEEEVSYANADIRLAGTLTFPSEGGPFPAAILISGSGPQDRNEEVFGHKPFLVLSDHLTRAGIAVLRVDDRGVGGSGGSAAVSTTEDFAGDVLAGIAFLKDREEIDPMRIGLIGHSEGGIIAPLVASRSDAVAFVIMLAGPGVPGDEILYLQTKLISLAAGADEESLAGVLEAHRELTAAVKSGAEVDEIRNRVRALIEAQLGGAESDAIDSAVEQTVAQMTSPWFRFFLGYDPRPALAKVRVPVLALNGELDLQVDSDQNLPEIRKALEQGGNEDLTVEELPGLNHLFQKAETGSVEEYYALEETMNPAALDTTRDWILARFGRPAQAVPPKADD